MCREDREDRWGLKILLIGDIVGEPGRNAVTKLIPKIKQEERVEFVIGNGENAAGGAGITPNTARELFDSGIDVITNGDHIWDKKEIKEIIDTEKRLLRPANFPKGVPGRGAAVYKSQSGLLIGVINIVGRIFMSNYECPFRVAKEEIGKIKNETQIIVMDMHAEATSEKMAMGWYLDGMVSVIAGTHTHVQTADEKILPKGTAFITDLGMTGPYKSILGRRPDEILDKFLTLMPAKFEMASEWVELHGAIVDVDPSTGKALSIKRVQRKIE